jgi:hypothetical protein
MYSERKPSIGPQLNVAMQGIRWPLCLSYSLFSDCTMIRICTEVELKSVVAAVIKPFLSGLNDELYTLDLGFVSFTTV